MTSTRSDDPFDLDRFVQAQDPVHERALAEVRAGRKTSHWMWFVFPQIAGLGFSAMAQRFAIGSLAEARAYLAHPTLGARLREGVQAAMDSGEPSAERLFGGIDAAKFRSSLTLFAAAAPDDTLFPAALDRFYGGEPDPLTLAKLGPGGEAVGTGPARSS